jgi:ATP-dependent helicase/DNAse subunit B
MAKDKYSAVWVSHSSINDYLNCPRSYFLKNVYKDPKTGHKIKITSPALSLGQTVHEVVESLSVLPVAKRFNQPLISQYNHVWEKVSGKKGGFFDEAQEKNYKDRGEKMIKMVQKNPGPLVNLAIKIKMDLPYFWLSEEDNIILCGKIDWLEYLEKSNSVHIIDFKTSKNEEDEGSLQLPIYHLLATNCQERKVKKASYWYLEKGPDLTSKSLPDLKDSKEKILKIAKKIKLARQLEKYDCPKKGCFYCSPMEKILNGEAEFVGIDELKRDTYVIPPETENRKGEIL